MVSFGHPFHPSPTFFIVPENAFIPRERVLRFTEERVSVGAAGGSLKHHDLYAPERLIISFSSLWLFAVILFVMHLYPGIGQRDRSNYACRFTVDNFCLSQDR